MAANQNAEPDRPLSPLQREIRQSRPFRSTAHEAAVGLLRTADLLRQALAAAVAPHDLTPQQYNVLRILRGAGDAGLPTLEISDRMLERAPGITRLLDRLEAKGLVRRERCPADRRQVLCWPTEKALSLVDALDPVIDALDTGSMAALEEAAQRGLISALDAIRAAHHNERTSTPPGPSPNHERNEP